jgi:hypothetical protein
MEMGEWRSTMQHDSAAYLSHLHSSPFPFLIINYAIIQSNSWSMA